MKVEQLLTGFLKKELIGILQKIVKDIQDRKAKITDEMVQGMRHGTSDRPPNINGNEFEKAVAA